MTPAEEAEERAGVRAVFEIQRPAMEARLLEKGFTKTGARQAVESFIDTMCFLHETRQQARR